jgi:hypothetical protein
VVAVNPQSTEDGVTEVGDEPERSDSALGELAYRVRDRLGGWTTTPFPEGFWTLEVNRATRKVWEGYARRVHLETELYPGRGWRVYVDSHGPEGYAKEFIGNPRERCFLAVEPSDAAVLTGHVDSGAFLSTSPIRDPEDAPRFPRRVAFQTAERWMSEYAMDGPDE